MSLIFSSVLLAAFGLSLILITLSLRLLRGANPAGDSYSTGARFFLICLRLAIGWHCLVEGMEKFSTPGWSSEAYLRESTGPLSPLYRSIAGDRLIEKLTFNDDAFPEALEREWRSYLSAFSAYYDLSDEQVQRAQAVFDQRKADMKTEFAKPVEVTKISAYPPPLTAMMTMQQRLKEYDRLLAKVNEAEAKFPSEDKGAHADWKRAKADLAKWRGELKTTLDTETAKLKKALHDGVLTSEQRQRPPMPDPARLPIGSWQLLEWSDAIVMWSLLVLGACLLLGIFSRASSLLTALLVLSFYLAMPPLPGWPEGPRLEGHYLLVNKTLIEVIALLALAFIPTGRWAGLDGLLQFVLPGCGGCANKTPDAPKGQV